MDSILQLVLEQWGKVTSGVFTYPLSFNTIFSYAAIKNSDHGGGIPNVTAVTKTAMNVELEWITWAGGAATQNTYATSAVHMIVVGA